MKTNLRKIGFFLSVTFALSSIFYYLIIKGSMTTLLTLGLMWVPGLSAIFVELAFERSLKGLGWKFGKLKHLGLSFVIPFAACLIVYGLVWLSGLGGVSISRFESVYHMPTGTVLLMLPTLFFLFNLFAALGEEIGWRGFLVSELSQSHSYTKTSLITAVIWFLWHCPLIIFSSYHVSSSPLWYNLLMVFVTMTAFTFIIASLRLKSGSLWTAVIFHGSHNLLIQQVFDVLTIDYGSTKFITSEFGVGIALVYTFIAILNIRESNLST